MKRNLMALLVSIAMGCGGEAGVARGGDNGDLYTARRMHAIRDAGDAEAAVMLVAGLVQPMAVKLASQPVTSLVLRSAGGTATIRGSVTDATVSFDVYSARTTHGSVTLSGEVSYRVSADSTSIAAAIDIQSAILEDSFDANARAVGGRFTGTLTSMSGETFQF